MADSDCDEGSESGYDSHPDRTAAETEMELEMQRARHLSDEAHVGAHLNQLSEQAEEEDELGAQIEKRRSLSIDGLDTSGDDDPGVSEVGAAPKRVSDPLAHCATTQPLDDGIIIKVNESFG